MKNIFFLVLFAVLAISCTSDDDICTSGEATPRLKVKFKNNATGNVKTLDSLYVGVDYGDGKITGISASKNVDSVMVPIRVEDVPFTDVYFKVKNKGSVSKVRLKYSLQSKYVSPACGIKRLYENVEPSLQVANPVLLVEQNQTSIIDESKTHIYLHF